MGGRIDLRQAIGVVHKSQMDIGHGNGVEHRPVAHLAKEQQPEVVGPVRPAFARQYSQCLY